MARYVAERSSGVVEPQLGPKKRHKILRLFLWVAFFIALYVMYHWFIDNIEAFLRQSPFFWSIYEAIKNEIAARSLLGLFYVSFFGALFFLPLPVEGVFIFYLTVTDFSPVLIMLMALAGNLLGLVVDYFTGRLLGPHILQWFMKERYEHFARRLNRAGGFLIIIGNIIPFPIEPLTLVLGATRYGFTKLILYSALGKIVKFLSLFYGYEYFLTRIKPAILALDVPPWLSFIKAPLLVNFIYPSRRVVDDGTF